MERISGFGHLVGSRHAAGAIWWPARWPSRHRPDAAPRHGENRLGTSCRRSRTCRALRPYRTPAWSAPGESRRAAAVPSRSQITTRALPPSTPAPLRSRRWDWSSAFHASRRDRRRHSHRLDFQHRARKQLPCLWLQQDQCSNDRELRIPVRNRGWDDRRMESRRQSPGIQPDQGGHIRDHRRRQLRQQLRQPGSQQGDRRRL